jgi:hypothetical protein
MFCAVIISAHPSAGTGRGRSVGECSQWWHQNVTFCHSVETARRSCFCELKQTKSWQCVSERSPRQRSRLGLSPKREKPGKQAHPVLKYRVPHGSHVNSFAIATAVILNTHTRQRVAQRRRRKTRGGKDRGTGHLLPASCEKSLRHKGHGAWGAAAAAEPASALNTRTLLLPRTQPPQNPARSLERDGLSYIGGAAGAKTQQVYSQRHCSNLQCVRVYVSARERVCAYIVRL